MAKRIRSHQSRRKAKQYGLLRAFRGHMKRLISHISQIVSQNLNSIKLAISWGTRCINLPPVQASISHFRPLFYPTLRQKSVTLDADLLTGSGIRESKMVMFLHQSCREQIRFISNVIDKTGYGYIHGPPGTGKSLTTLYSAAIFASALHVLWIHLPWCGRYPSETCTCIILKNGKKYCFDAEVANIAYWLRNDGCLGSKAELLILDGLTSVPCHLEIDKASHAWYKARSETRRLLHVSPMDNITNYREQEDKKRVFVRRTWRHDEHEGPERVD